jgi:hypothetical protein
MPRHAVPILAVLALAGCGGGARSEAAHPATAVQAVPAPRAKVEPAPAAPRKRKGDAAPAIAKADGPALPADFGSDTTVEQLAAHALIVAREEVAADQAGGAGVMQRRDALVALWTPQLQQRQRAEAAIRAERDRTADQQAAEAGRLAEQEAKLREVEADYGHRLETESRRTAPIESQ